MTSITQEKIEKVFHDDGNIKSLAIQIAQAIKRNADYTIVEFVTQLGFALASPDVELRVKGTSLLSAVLTELPSDYLNAQQLQFLTTFYVDRLKDHHNVIPPWIDGFGALVRMQFLPKESVAQLLRQFFQHTSCQSQLRSDRTKLFKIFKYLCDMHEAELKSMEGDFIYGLINSIDGERDPRNLDFIFEFMPHVIGKFPLLHLAEDMFETFACYFPVDFNASFNDPNTITREILAEKLSDCLVASAEFIEFAVTLALEKLTSDLVASKLDSLELLHKSALNFSPEAMAEYFMQIWTALKNEIFCNENADIIAAILKALRSLLERAAVDAELSASHQTIILGAILPHLSDATQRMFQPAIAIALVCIAGDPAFAGEKVLESFLLKVNTVDETQKVVDEQRIKYYTTSAQIFKIAAMRNALDRVTSGEVCAQLHACTISSLSGANEQLELKRAALNVLNESVPLITESNRALVYKTLVELLTHAGIDLDCSQLLAQLGALHPVELQAHCLDICIQNFDNYSDFIKKKIYKNLLPLVHQTAFKNRILNFIFAHVFKPTSVDTATDNTRLLALVALNSLLIQEAACFVVELQQQYNLIDKLVQLAKSLPTETEDFAEFSQIAAVISCILQQLSVAEQYTIANEYLPALNLQLTSHLFVAKGLLAFLHANISLDDHFERLCQDLTELSLQSNNAQLREVAHHLLCSLCNKIDYKNAKNRNIIAATMAKLKAEIEKGDAKAVEALSWLAKGLTVRGCDEAGDIVEDLAKLLNHPTLSNAAALAFDVVAAEYPNLHLPVVKFLFKQKLFQKVLATLGHQLETFCEHHLNAFVYVLKATPYAVVKMHLDKVGPMLFKSLESSKTHTLCISLEICENFVKKQDEYFRSHLNHLIPSCLLLSRFKQSMEVRIFALKLLRDVCRYPVFVLLPYRMDVVLELSAALDDSKRLVRNAAVSARDEWFLIGSPNSNNDNPS